MNLIFGISLHSSLTLTSDVIFKDDPSCINLTNTNNIIMNSEHSEDSDMSCRYCEDNMCLTYLINEQLSYTTLKSKYTHKIRFSTIQKHSFASLISISCCALAL
jgi:hypothetical protein